MIPTTFDRARAPRSRARDVERRSIFDNSVTFVLDIPRFSTIIYIWYEGGQLRPSLVRLSVNLTLRTWAISSDRRGRCQRSDERRLSGERARRQPQRRWSECSRKSKPT